MWVLQQAAPMCLCVCAVCMWPLLCWEEEAKQAVASTLLTSLPDSNMGITGEEASATHHCPRHTCTRLSPPHLTPPHPLCAPPHTHTRPVPPLSSSACTPHRSCLTRSTTATSWPCCLSRPSTPPRCRTWPTWRTWSTAATTPTSTLDWTGAGSSHWTDSRCVLKQVVGQVHS